MLGTFKTFKNVRNNLKLSILSRFIKNKNGLDPNGINSIAQKKFNLPCIRLLSSRI